MTKNLLGCAGPIVRMIFLATTAGYLCSCVSNRDIGGRENRPSERETKNSNFLHSSITANDIIQATNTIGIEIVGVPLDPVYGAPHRYRAMSLRKVLEKFTGKGESQTVPDSEIVFFCEDGYQAIVHNEMERISPAFLAFSDVDADPDQDWVPISKPTGPIVPGPLYLVWTNSSASGTPWPYQIIRMELRPTGLSLVPAEPSRNPLPEAGFALFQRNCMNCHSVNGAGGKLGIELNVPLNVTEYWKPSALRKLIHDPSSIRANSKMPAFPQLTDSDIAALIAYLKDMKNRKQSRPAGT